jgi:tetratricopeptide (TPR) repeat protein
MQHQLTWIMTFAFALVAPACCSAQQTDPPPGGYYDLGGFHQQVTTDSKPAQVWFDRGLAMCFGFNHEEAARCFQRAVAADPGMPMAYWGMAYAWGPNMNNMEIEPHKIAQAALAIEFAKLHAGAATKLERDLIEALATRYATPVPDDREPLNRAYAEAMEEVYQAHGDEPLVATLYAESLINLQPWGHWSPEWVPAAGTAKIVDVLEGALARWPTYPALCHLYIHTMEMSPTPEKALPFADRLRDAIPGCGHLVHMPSHIDILLGLYQNAIIANQKAIVADKGFVEQEGRHNFYTLYRIHNFHFLVYGAMFDGQSKLAMQAARDLVSEVPEDMLQAQTDFLDAFIPTPLHVMVRFGDWDAILDEPQPAEYLPMSRSVWRYARALAHAANNQVAAAKAEQQAFAKQRAVVPETSFLFQNSSRSILGVAEEMIAGEIAYREEKFDTAFEHFREAVRRDDALNYDEPWGWMQPARHALGALLLEQNRTDEAEQVYRADLKRHPHNPWSLHGLAECCARKGDADQAKEFRKQFQQATARSDVDIDRSCYCRLGAAD